MLSAEIDNLNFTDVVSFAEKLLHLKLPPPPNDFLEFQKIKWYVCPAGLTIQNVVYPPGFSFESDMTLFGKSANVSCGTCFKYIVNMSDPTWNSRERYSLVNQRIRGGFCSGTAQSERARRPKGGRLPGPSRQGYPAFVTRWCGDALRRNIRPAPSGRDAAVA